MIEQKLQRAIAEYRGQTADRRLPSTLYKVTSAEGSYRSDDSAAESTVKRAEPPTIGTTGTSTKRKYRRHPKVSCAPVAGCWPLAYNLVFF